MIVIAYHGTTSSRAAKILNEGFSTEGLGRRSRARWLGAGAYFFQEGFGHSMTWAKDTCDRVLANTGVKETPAVLEVKVNIGNIIDLVDGGHWHLIRAIYQENKQALDQQKQVSVADFLSSRDPPEGLYEHYVDYMLITYYKRFVSDFRKQAGLAQPTAIRAALFEGRPVHDRSWLFEQSSIALCVFDVRSIEGVSEI